MGKHHHKKGFGTCDYMLLGLGGLGAMMACAATFGGDYLRARPCATINWPMRKYYVQKITDKSMIPSANWKMLKMEMCQKYDQAQQKYGNPLMTAGMGMFSAMGGMIPKCDVKPACREHLSTRCINYGYQVLDGMILHGTQFLALCLFGCAGMCLMVSAKPAWKTNAAVCASLAFLMSSGGCAYWLVDSMMMQHEFAKDTIWPHPKPQGGGFYANSMGCVMMLIAALCGFAGAMPESKVEDDPMMDPMMGGEY